jgi:hypothetical protein
MVAMLSPHPSCVVHTVDGGGGAESSVVPTASAAIT